MDRTRQTKRVGQRGWRTVGILALAVAAVLPACGEESPAASSDPAPPPTDTPAPAEKPPGNWRVAKDRGGRRAELDEATRKQLEELEELEALGYAGGYEEVPDRIGTTRHDPARAHPGHNLIISGHDQDAALVDMEGRVLHRWAYDCRVHYPIHPDYCYWRRAHLTGRGELYVICDPHGIVKLDKDSKLIWATTGKLHLHHDLCVPGNGRVYALGKTFLKRPELHPTKDVITDWFVEIDDDDGSVLESFQIFDAFEQSPDREELVARISEHARLSLSDKIEDLHTNTIEWLDGSHAALSPLLKRGNLLCCSPTRYLAWIIDPELEEVVWSWFGPWAAIHQTTITDAGHLLLFHNSGYEGPNGQVSQVLEYDFPTLEERWRYQGDPTDPDSEFYSTTSSLATRLPGGNTLIVVSESGRAIEVTPDGDIVWEYFNPKRAGERNEFIATLFQVVRVPVEQTAAWLER